MKVVELAERIRSQPRKEVDFAVYAAARLGLIVLVVQVVRHTSLGWVFIAATGWAILRIPALRRDRVTEVLMTEAFVFGLVAVAALVAARHLNILG